MGFHTFNLIAQSIQANEQLSHPTNHLFKVMVVLKAQEDKSLLDGLLAKILAAIHIDISKDVCLVKTAEPYHPINIINTIKDLNIDKVICFGVQPKDVALNFTNALYQPMHVGGLTFVFADTLSTLNKDANKKKALWGNLQQIFLKE